MLIRRQKSGQTVFNTFFYGSPLWDMSSRNFEKLEKSWNVSQRLMMSLPRTSHRYLIEPLSRKPHIIKSLKKRFLNFTKKIKGNQKPVLRNTLSVIADDCRSTTGKNLRRLTLETKNFTLDNVDFNLNPYLMLPKDQTWRINLAEEIIEIKAGTINLPNIDFKILDSILDFACSAYS